MNIRLSRLALAGLLALIAALPASAQRQTEEVLVEAERARAFEIEEFAREYFNALTDTTKVAHVKEEVLDRPTGKIHLHEGYILMQEPVRGRPYRAIFAGVGTFQMDCHVPIERRNLKKYWGQETVDDRFDRATFRIADDGMLAWLRGLEWQETEAVEAAWGEDSEDDDDGGSDSDGSSEDGEADAWSDPELRAKKAKGAIRGLLKQIRENQEEREKDPPDERAFKSWQIGEHNFLMEEARKAYYGEDYPGAWQVTLRRVVKDVSGDEVYVTGFEYSESPHGSPLGGEEFYLQLNTNFGNNYQQLACAWHYPEEYQEDLLYTGTSPTIDAEEHNEIRVRDVEFQGVIKGDRLDARTDFTVEAQEDGVQMIAFELLGNLHVKSLRWVPEGSAESAAVPLQVYRPENPNFSEIWVSDVNTILPRVLEKGEKARLLIEYEGKALERVASGFFQAINRLGWFPDRDLSAVRLDATFWSDPKRLVTATGNPADCRPEQQGRHPGMTCRRWVVQDPPVRLATFNVASDVKDDLITPDDVEGLKVPVRSLAHNRVTRQFCYSDQSGRPWCKEYNLSKSTEMIKGIAAFSLSLFEDRFGYYPYQKLDLVPWEVTGAAQSPPSLITLPYNAFVTTTALNEIVTAIQEQQARSQSPGQVGTPNPWTWREIISHEVSHQWWGHILYWNTYRDQWLSEGMADFSSAYFLEFDDYQNRTDYAQKEWGERTELLTRDDHGGETVGPVALGFRINSPLNPDGFQGWYSIKIYRKGAYIAQMLRSIFRALAYQQFGPQEAATKGDELFFNMVRDFVETHRNGAVSNLMFQRTAEKHLGGDLGWFFNQWLYNDGIPKIRWAYEWVPRGDGYGLKIRVHQENTDFQFPVTVTLRKGKGKKAAEAAFPMMVQSKDHVWEWGGQPFDAPWDSVSLNEDRMLLAEIDAPEPSLSGLDRLARK